MNVSIRSLAVGLILVSASLVAGCGGGSGKPVPGMGCAINSDCATGLICTFGICHTACMANGDCPTGEMCVKTNTSNGDGGTINTCQLPFEETCVYNSQCKSPLVCARDEQCRNQCQTAVDCLTGDVCTPSGVCATPAELNGKSDVPLVTTGRDGGFDAFQSGTAGESGSGGTGGAAGSPATGTGGSAGSPGTGGAAGGAGGATGTGGKGGAGGAGGAGTTCSPGCGPGTQCVNGSCQACGTSGAVCCGTPGTCNSNLTCVSGTCTCGGASQACCGGSSCTSGLACVSGVCSCGGAGQSCCSGKTCMGSFICGGISCGCEQACDGYAVQKIDGTIYVNTTPVTNIDDSAFKATSFSYNSSVSCGVKADTSVWCWGSNTYGALGLGNSTTTSSTTPVQVMYMNAGTLTPLMGITEVDVADSGYTVCAIGAQGTVWCWGYGQYGELGNGLKGVNSGYAVPVVDATSTAIVGAEHVAVGNYHTCMMKTEGSVWCWGDNTYGEIGDGSAPSSSVPIVNPSQVKDLGNTATSIAVYDVEYSVSCASTADGGAWCWGGNGYGGLGNGMMSGNAQVPATVDTAAATALTNVAKIVDWGYAYKMCALKNDASLWCWGTPSALYATPLIDNTNMAVAGITTIGRSCYLDANNKAWVNGATSTNYQVPCP